MKITLISDTHTKHKEITKDLIGGDLIIHAGDLSNMGYLNEVRDFFKWYKQLPYDEKVFICGNHDFGFQDYPVEIEMMLREHPEIDYLQDNMYVIGDDYTTGIKIYGSPWQPRFYDWAFNADRGDDIKQHWDKIPNDIDILVTHGPAFGHLDKIIGQTNSLGCEELTKAIERVKPKIHVCGHIHSGRNIVFSDGTLFINASVLNEQYQYTQKPITIDFDFKTREWEVIQF